MKRNLITIIAAAAVLGLSACSTPAQSSSLPAGGQTSAGGGSAGSPGAPGGAGRGFGAFPGVSGLVAAITGRTAQVQGTTQQTAVTWTGSTRFTDQMPTSAAAVKVGECVMARPARVPATPSGAPSGGTGGTPTPAPGSVTSVAAATVELLPSQGGTCSFGRFGGRVDGQPSGTPTGSMPTRPTTGQGGGQGGGPGGFARRLGAIGTVTAVGAGQFTVTPVMRVGGTAATPVTVTYTAATSFTRLVVATAAAMKVGTCVTAQGRTDDTGALTAISIAISAPVGGSCQTGLGGRGLGAGSGTGSRAAPAAGAGNA